jgi:hypothetical protein
MKTSRKQPPIPKNVNSIWNCKYICYCSETCLVSAPYGVPNIIKAGSNAWWGFERCSDGFRLAEASVGSGTLVGANFTIPVQVSEGSKPFTILWRIPINVADVNRNGGLIMIGGGNGYAHYCSVERNIGNTVIGISFSENYSLVRGASFTFTESQSISSFFTVYNGSSIKLYQNNIELNASLYNSGNPSSSGYLTAVPDIISYATVEPTTMIAWFPYALNSEQREELSGNPWALFQEKTWLFTGMGSGSYTPYNLLP